MSNDDEEQQTARKQPRRDPERNGFIAEQGLQRRRIGKKQLPYQDRTDAKRHVRVSPYAPSRRERSHRDINENARDVARRKMNTQPFLKSRDQRKRVEMRLARLKTHHRFERMRLRGLSGARAEFHRAAIVQDLKTLALHPEGKQHT